MFKSKIEKLTEQRKNNGWTEEMFAAAGGPELIRAFAAAGGKFTDYQDKEGETSGMLAANGGAESIEAYAAAGGQFTDQQDRFGQTAAMRAVYRGPEAIRAYAAAGGKFTFTKTHKDWTAGRYATDAGSPRTILAFAEAGGKFDKKHDNFSRILFELSFAQKYEAMEAFISVIAAQNKAEGQLLRLEAFQHAAEMVAGEFNLAPDSASKIVDILNTQLPARNDATVLGDGEKVPTKTL